MVHIRVTGSGQVRSAPDEATFQFHCQGFAAEAPDALSQATLAAETVLGLLDGLGVPPQSRGVQRARVHPRTRWDGDREIRDGWNANATVECTLSDATLAFELLEQATAIDRVSIHGPEWQIRPTNPAHDSARQLAVAEGRMKAESYAHAAGLTLGDLHELVEGGAVHASPMMRSMGASEATSLEASDQIVHATVTLVFEAS